MKVTKDVTEGMVESHKYGLPFITTDDLVLNLIESKKKADDQG